MKNHYFETVCFQKSRMIFRTGLTVIAYFIILFSFLFSFFALIQSTVKWWLNDKKFYEQIAKLFIVLCGFVWVTIYYICVVKRVAIISLLSFVNKKKKKLTQKQKNIQNKKIVQAGVKISVIKIYFVWNKLKIILPKKQTVC